MTTIQEIKQEFKIKFYYFPKNDTETRAISAYEVINILAFIENVYKLGEENGVKEYQKLEQMTYLGFKTPAKDK